MSKHISELNFRELYKKNSYIGISIIAMLMTGYLFLEIKNDRFTAPDFKVYYRAAGDLMTGENLYRHPEAGHYVFKYSPVCAMYFIPLAILPLELAKVFYWFFLVILICYGLMKSYHLIDPQFGLSGDAQRFNNLILLTALIISVHAARELELGQVNHPLYVLYIAVIMFFQKKSDVFLALPLAVSVFIKPFGLIFLPWLIYKKKFKAVGYFTLFLILLAILPVIFTGFNQLADQYAQWYNELRIELAAKQSLLAEGNHTIFSLLARFTPIGLTQAPQEFTALYQFIILLCLAGLFIWILRMGRNTERSEVLEGAVLIASIPMLAFTSYNAFGFSELAVCIGLYYFRQLDRWLKILAVTGIVMLGGNIYELVGRDLWKILDNYSIVSFGTGLLIIMLIAIRYKKIA